MHKSVDGRGVNTTLTSDNTNRTVAKFIWYDTWKTFRFMHYTVDGRGISTTLTSENRHSVAGHGNDTALAGKNGKHITVAKLIWYNTWDTVCFMHNSVDGRGIDTTLTGDNRKSTVAKFIWCNT
jgi:hypothetical protein